MLNQINTFFPPCAHKSKANKCDYHKVSLCNSCSLAFHYCCDIKVDTKNCSTYIEWAITTFTNLINGVEEEAKKLGMNTYEELLEWIKSEKDKIREVTLEIEKIENEGFISLEDNIKFKDILRRMIHDAFNSHMYKYILLNSIYI